MYHSVTFVTRGPWHPTRPFFNESSVNSWDDWHLIPTSRPVIAPPEAETHYEDTPISDGVYDLTDVLTGAPKYRYREGNVRFMVENGYRNWVDLYSEIADLLHGQYVRVILEDDPLFFYEGRVFVDKWECERHCSYISIGYKFKPEKTVIEQQPQTQEGTQ